LLAEFDIGATLGSARIVLEEEFIESCPTSSHTNHDGGTQDSDETQFLRFSESVFSFSDLEDFELLLASAKRHLSVDFVVDAFGVGQRSAVLPIRSESGHELSPVNHSVAVVELVCDRVHLETR
jgi:hypothetical protein